MKSYIGDEVGGIWESQESIQIRFRERHSFSEVTISLEAVGGWAEQGLGPFSQQGWWDTCGTLNGQELV